MCKIFVRQCLHCVIYFLKAHNYKLLKIRENSPPSFPDSVMFALCRTHYIYIDRINQDHKKALCPYLDVFGVKL